MTSWWLRLSRYALPHKKMLFLLATLTLANVLLNVIIPWPIKLIVDNVLTDREIPNYISWITLLPGGGTKVFLLAWLAFSTIIIFILIELVKTIQDYQRIGLSRTMVYKLGKKLLLHIQNLSLRFHGKSKTGDLIRRVITDSSCIEELVFGVYFPLFTSIISLLIMFYVMWRLDHVLSAVAILLALPLCFLIKLFSKPMSDRVYDHQRLEGEIISLTEQALTAIPVIQAFGREEFERERFRNLTDKTHRAYIQSILSELQFKIGVSSVTAIGTAIVMGIGGLRVLQGNLTVGSLLVFLSYLVSLYVPMETLAYIGSGFAAAKARARRVMEILDVEDVVQERPSAIDFKKLPAGKAGHIRFEEITFGYDENQPILKDINLDIFPGEKVALVGKTGAGKSTLISLIPRFFDPWGGSIFIDGTDIRDIRVLSLRANISILLQDPFILPISVAENISYSRPTAEPLEIVEAAKAANAHEFIMRLPQGYETVVGEKGSTLSGGENQRLAIARAMLKDAPILILDEPTSSLDAKTESLVFKAVERLMENRTTIIIAHRSSTIRNADRIVVMDEGRIVETGTHHELLSLKGYYYNIQSSQLYDSSMKVVA